MNMIWRPTMALLTTLAALVIIAHCVEEDMESEYRHELRPRFLDTGTSNNDQPWRAIEEEPGVQKPRHTENWDDSSTDVGSKRRRPGRKRKRRPQAEPTEEPQERLAYPEQPPRPFYDVDSENFRQTTEKPKRRRKTPETRPVRWTDDDIMVVERPLRNNGGRRKKRPSLETWPDLSEFTHIDNTNQDEEEIEPESNPHKVIAEKVFGHNRGIEQHKSPDTEEHHDSIAIADIEDTEQTSKDPVTADKSLSEFSLELVPKPKTNRDHESDKYESRIRIPETNLPEMTETEVLELEDQKPKLHNMSVRVRKIKKKKEHTEDNEQYKATEKVDTNQADELSLKDILKRSNGTSLSEILQQHNLSLSDLLRGKEHAVSILKHKSTLKNKISNNNVIKVDSNEQPLLTSETKYSTEPIIEFFSTTEAVQIETVQPEIIQTETVQPEAIETEAIQVEAVPTEAVQTETPVETTQTTTVKPLYDVTRMSTSRRYLVGLRKKLRMRPVLNTTNTFKGQLSRDIVAINTRKYSNFRRNRTKTKLWTDIFPSVTQNNTYKENNNKTVHNQRPIVNVPEETTTSIEVTSRNNSYEDIHPQVNTDVKLDDIEMDVTESLIESVTEITTETSKIVLEKSVGIVTMPRPTAISSGLRQQALNNRLKRKRLKNKNSTTESPQDDIIKHLFGMSNLVSSSEFIARTQEPRTTEQDSTELTTLNDFLTTERTKRTKGHVRITTTQTTTPKLTTETTTTEETAKIEIEEIFNDTKSRAKLSRILKERNMTLTELVELRERGSSHVHLADIFHNASKEPNPAEPFLSKSLLEPISKETYPLRAILEANLHDPSGRVTTIDSNSLNSITIPVAMDFGNNVNENAENMGIMSLFNNITKNTTQSTTSTDTEHKNLTVPEIASNITNRNQTVRESRVLDDIKDDIVSWNDIFSMMGNNPNSGNEESSTNQPFKKITIEEDVGGDGLIVLEDLQRLTNFDRNIALISKEKLDVKPDTEKGTGVNDHMTSHTKSITVATASIAGLVMVLFLLTYVTYKWKRQRSLARKRSFCDERIPTPVFEARKANKNNSSTRSISPMLQTSNIYTLNTLDSQNGKESPDYMWDSLRKPFQ